AGPSAVPAGRGRLQGQPGRIRLSGRQLLAAHHLRQRAGLHQARWHSRCAVHNRRADGRQGHRRRALRRAAGAARRGEGEAIWRPRRQGAGHRAGQLHRRPGHNRRQLRLAGARRARRPGRSGVRHELGGRGLQLGVRCRHDPRDRDGCALHVVDPGRSTAGTAPGRRARRRQQDRIRTGRMRIRTLAAAMAATCAMSATAHADEGMWMPSQLPEIAAQLKAAGYQGDPAALADLTRPPMNAIVSLGGCTASFVSPNGLVVTNHHCAMGAIQLNSTPQDNLIANGFIAADQAAERSAGPAARIFVTVAFDRITDRVLADARGKTGRAYYDAVDAAQKAVVAECEADAGYRCSVADMYYGTDFYLVKQLEITDVRLVYAPPEAIGNYGDEIDNFMWPRHSGDFAFYRAYVGKDGKPAPYSQDNVPYAPPAWLTVSTDPVAEGDYVMLAGYPGRTYRHRMAMEFAEQVNDTLPSRVDIYGALVDTIEKAV